MRSQHRGPGFDPWAGSQTPHGTTRIFPVAQMVKSLLAMQETRFNPWVRKTLWRREWQPTPVVLPGESHGQKSLVGYSPWRVGHDLATNATLHGLHGSTKNRHAAAKGPVWCNQEPAQLNKCIKYIFLNRAGKKQKTRNYHTFLALITDPSRIYFCGQYGRHF